MGTDYLAVYRDRAEDYDRLIAAEDADRRLLPALGSIAPIEGRTFVDVGAGTGRVTRMLLSAGARQVLAFDQSAAMLAVAERHLALEPRERWQLAVADAGALPIAGAIADHAVAGWVFGHLRSWAPDWRVTIEAAIAEMSRVVKPGGTLAIIETLGTAREEPVPPTPQLAEYYEWLERTQRMERIWVRSDYQFEDLETAIELTGFFFGPEMASWVRARGSARVPECSGIWWRRSAD